MPKHLKILAITEPRPLSDEQTLRQLAEETIAVVGMRPLLDPQVANVEIEINKLGQEPFEDEGGISVMQMLSTSHLALHTWPLRCEIHFEIYSCREFSQEEVLKVFAKYVRVRKIKISDVSASCDWDPG